MKVYRICYDTHSLKWNYLWVIAENYKNAIERAELILSEKCISNLITDIALMGEAYIDYREMRE